MYSIVASVIYRVYRPVSLTSVPCKIMESIIKEKLTMFLDCNELLCKEQHGFNKGRSCLTNLLESLENWTKALDDGFGLDIIYLDYRKAFDTRQCPTSKTTGEAEELWP